LNDQAAATDPQTTQVTAKHAHSLASGQGLSGVALQGDQLFKSSTGDRPVVMHLGHLGADDQDVFALREALQRLMRRQIGIGQPFLANQIGNGLSDLGSFNWNKSKGP
jgi:hypothetical protein